jgi:choline dehydrogenase-like flavoprotein
LTSSFSSEGKLILNHYINYVIVLSFPLQFMSTSSNTYDAIVIGSGISGGWAAKELCDKGLKTLVLERGRNIEHLKDYPSATKNPWEFPHRGQLPSPVLEENPVAGRCSAFEEATEHFL